MDWSVKKLGDLVTFERGLTYSKDAEVDFSSKGVLRSNNVDLDTNSLNLDEIKYLNESFSIPSSKKVVKNSLLMCMSNGSKSHLGKVAIIEEDLGYAFGGFMGLLTPNQEVFPRFLYYYLISPEYKRYIQGLSDGANINNLKYKDLSVFPIALPSSISEQKRIVDILDAEFAKIDALKENAERSLQNARDLFQAVLRKELEPKEEWKMSTIGSECKTGAGGTPNKSYKEYYEGGDVPWLRSGEVCRKYITETEMYITQLGVDNSSAKWFPVNTVVVAMYGATAGQVGILHIPTTTNQAICGIFPNSKYIPEFLYYVIASQKKELVAQATGNAQPNISQVKVKGVKIPILDIENQKLIISRLEKLNEYCQSLEINYERTIALCNDLKQALLRKAFNGEL